MISNCHEENMMAGNVYIFHWTLSVQVMACRFFGARHLLWHYEKLLSIANGIFGTNVSQILFESLVALFLKMYFKMSPVISAILFRPQCDQVSMCDVILGFIYVYHVPSLPFISLRSVKQETMPNKPRLKVSQVWFVELNQPNMQLSLSWYHRVYHYNIYW